MIQSGLRNRIKENQKNTVWRHHQETESTSRTAVVSPAALITMQISPWTANTAVHSSNYSFESCCTHGWKDIEVYNWRIEVSKMVVMSRGEKKQEEQHQPKWWKGGTMVEVSHLSSKHQAQCLSVSVTYRVSYISKSKEKEMIPLFICMEVMLSWPCWHHWVDWFCTGFINRPSQHRCKTNWQWRAFILHIYLVIQ